MFIQAGGRADGDHVGVGGVEIEIIQVFISGGKQDHAPFSVAPFLGRFGNGGLLQGVEPLAGIGGAPAAADDVRSVFDAIVKHGLRIADGEGCAADRHETCRRSGAYDTLSVGSGYGYACAGGAVGIAGVTLEDRR